MKIDTKYETERLVSKDPTHLHLQNLHYDLQKQRLVVTNGHALAMVPVTPDEGDASGWVSIDALKAARKAAGGRSEAEIHANGSLAISDGVTFPRPNVETAFPPYEQVVPDYRQGSPGTVTIGLNAALLLELAKALGAHKKKSGPMIYLTIKLPKAIGPDIPKKPNTSSLMLDAMLDPVVISAGEDERAIGVIMPCRV
jgi:hypothetical protein